MEKRNLINGYYLLEQDLKEIFSFIEPVPSNYSTYSHRLYALFVRACMEFEANCKMILVDKGFKLSENPNINIYYKIHSYDEYKLINDYIVRLQMSEEIDLTPLKQWEEARGPSWYREHHAVKHSRLENFDKANLKNVLDATASVYVLLYSRYGKSALNRYQETAMIHHHEGFIWKEDSLFKIKKPKDDPL